MALWAEHETSYLALACRQLFRPTHLVVFDKAKGAVMNAEHTVTQLAMWLGTALLACGLGWIFGLPGILAHWGLPPFCGPRLDLSRWRSEDQANFFGHLPSRGNRRAPMR